MFKFLMRFQIILLLLVFFAGAGYANSKSNLNLVMQSHLDSNHLNVTNDYTFRNEYKPAIGSSQGKGNTRPTFIINNSITDLNEFRQLVQAASRLKKYGDVQINIGVVADKAFYEIPEGDNPWNEYASNFANLYKFYPDKKIAPFIPEKFVRDNVQLLLAKTKILRENGVDAAFFSNEPEFMPSAFFEAYPEFRGARVDHPRRSKVPFFSPCLSVKGVQDMYA